MIQVRQLEQNDAAAATNLWSSAMREPTYAYSKERINRFVESKLKDPNDMGDVFSSYVNGRQEEEDDSKVSHTTNGSSMVSGVRDKDRENLPIRNFWVVEYIPQNYHQGKI